MKKTECRDCQKCTRKETVDGQVRVCWYTEKEVPPSIIRNGGYEKDCPLLVNSL